MQWRPWRGRRIGTAGQRVAAERPTSPARTTAAHTQALGHLEDGVLLIEQERVTWLNPAAIRMFAGVENPQGRPVLEVVRDHRIDALVSRARHSGLEEASEVELPLSHRMLSLRAVPLESGDILLLARDLTRLRYLETVRQQFVANLVHDMRTPLAGLDLAAQTLAAELPAKGSARNFLNRLLQESQRLQAMVANLSQLAALDDRGVRVERAAFEVSDMVGRLQERNRAAASTKGLGLRTQAARTPISAWGDRDKTDQALQNIVENAIKFTDAGGVVISVTRDVERVEIMVSDSGPGIPPADLPRIFERFYKADRSRSSQPGSGLGLSIARHLIELQGGTITAHSTPNEGTQMRVRLPSAPLTAP